jgi:dUTP diphosphatase
MKVRVINHSGNPNPIYQTDHAAGMDIRANLQSPEALDPLERKLIPTGLFLEIPEGFEAQIRPRSGLAFKHGITVLNSPGTIDADYRGEVMVLLVNLSNEPFNIENGERIAQMVVTEHSKVEWIESEELTFTKRGHGGIGSTGNQ